MTALDVAIVADEVWNVGELGQLPFHPPNVAGWPVGPQWVGPGRQLLRASMTLDRSWPDRLLLDRPRWRLATRSCRGRAASLRAVRVRADDARRQSSRSPAGSPPTRAATACSSRWGWRVRKQRAADHRGRRPLMPENINRRDFLRLAGLGGGAAMLGALGPGHHTSAGATEFPLPAAGARRHVGAAAADVASRILVVLEMAGGNDGPSMAPPADAERLRSLRPSASHPVDALLRPGSDVILHPALERLQIRPLTVVDGVGSPAPDLSHFEMLRRWWAGDPDGTAAQPTGFLGRLCDAIDAGAPVTGLSVGGASTPALVSERAGTLGLPALWWLWWLGSDPDKLGGHVPGRPGGDGRAGGERSRDARAREARTGERAHRRRHRRCASRGRRRGGHGAWLPGHHAGPEPLARRRDPRRRPRRAGLPRACRWRLRHPRDPP